MYLLCAALNDYETLKKRFILQFMLLMFNTSPHNNKQDESSTVGSSTPFCRG